MTISASVGAGGVNRDDDVRAVQHALNAIPANQGGADPYLKVDGICGPKTRAAIQSFQARQLGLGIADGRIDVNGKTLGRINELLQQNEDPQYAAIIQAIEDVMKTASYATSSPGSVARFGFINPDVRYKLSSLQSLLAGYARGKSQV